jgi:hypothetical protein
MPGSISDLYMHYRSNPRSHRRVTAREGPLLSRVEQWKEDKGTDPGSGIS